MHDKTYCSGRVTVAEKFRDLPVRHYSSARNLPHDLINALAILILLDFRHIRLVIESSYYNACWRAITQSAAYAQRQTDQFIFSRGNNAEIQPLDNDHGL